MLEMAIFSILLIPMPSGVRRVITRWISTSSLVAQLQYFLKIMFVFVLILFLDSLNRAFKGEHEHDAASTNPHSDTHFHMKVFRAQRNMYLTGFTVFMSLLLNRFINMVTQMSKIEEELATLKKMANNNANQALKMLNDQKGGSDKDKKIEELEKQLEAAKKEALKAEAVVKQATNLSKEYDRLADRNNELEKKLQKELDNKKDK
jgi:B-cell receptor-associated protein 31